MSSQGSRGNVIAAVCNIFVPGLGHLVQGRIVGAIMFFVICGVLYSLGTFLILFFLYPFAVLFHLWAIISAARYKG